MDAIESLPPRVARSLAVAAKAGSVTCVIRMLNALAVYGYRSLRDLIVPLHSLNLVTGPNGSGKSNLYRALRLLAEIAQGRAIRSLAREGGLPLDAVGRSRTDLARHAPRRAAGRGSDAATDRSACGSASPADDFSYAIDLGLPTPPAGVFGARSGDQARMRLERPGAAPVGRARRPPQLGGEGPRSQGRVDDPHLAARQLRQHDDALRGPAADAGDADAARRRCAPGASTITSAPTPAAPARQPQIGTHTPVLSHDGSDLAAALQTIREIGDGDGARRGGGRRVSRCARVGAVRRRVRGRDEPARPAAAA